MPLEVQSLSRKQKRIVAWSELLEEGISDQTLQNKITEKLKLFRNLLAKHWENEGCNQEELDQLENLERDLEQLAEEARLFAR